MLELFSTLESPLNQCISALGSERFYPRFFNFMKVFARIEQYCAFEFDGSGNPLSCRLAHNPQQPHLNLQRASLYLDGSYLQDPLLQSLAAEIKEQPLEKRKPAYGRLQSKSLPPAYRQRFYSKAQLGEKFAMFSTDEESGHAFYINFYRDSKKPFDEHELERLTEGRSLICALLLRHFRMENEHRGALQPLLAAGLSEREAQICELITKGHTAKTMARKLGVAESSIITFRKRAYKKLGIERKSQLLDWLYQQP